jgi:hypothetical protein
MHAIPVFFPDRNKRNRCYRLNALPPCKIIALFTMLCEKIPIHFLIAVVKTKYASENLLVPTCDLELSYGEDKSSCYQVRDPDLKHVLSHPTKQDYKTRASTKVLAFHPTELGNAKKKISHNARYDCLQSGHDPRHHDVA